MPAFTPNQVREMNYAIAVKDALSNASYHLNLPDGNPQVIKAEVNTLTGEVSYAFDEEDIEPVTPYKPQG